MGIKDLEEFANSLSAKAGREDSATESWISGLKGKQAARTSAMLSYDHRNPDEVAESLRIGDEIGMPASIVTANPKPFKREAEQKRNSISLANAPKTTAWLADLTNSGLGKDDIGVLADMETFWREQGEAWVELGKRGEDTQFGRGVRTGVTGARQMGTALKTIPVSGMIRHDLDLLAGLQSIGDMNPDAPRYEVAEAIGVSPTSQAASIAFEFLRSDEDKRARIIDRTVQRLTSNKEAMSALAESVRAYSAAFERAAGRTPNFTDIDDAKAFADWLAYNTGQALPYLAITAIAGAVSGPGGLLASGYGMGVGDVQSDLIEQGIEDQGQVAMAAGVPYAGLELLGPAARPFRGVSGEILENVASNYFQRLAREIPANAVEEFVNEAGQEIIADIASEVAGGEEIALTDETLLRWFNAGMAGVAGGAGVSVVTAGPSRGSEQDRNAAANSNRTAQKLATVDALALKSKLKARSPDHFQSALEAQGAGMANLYVPADAMREYFQAKDTPLDEALSEWGVDRSAFEDAEVTGGDVAIPMSVYATRISGTDDAPFMAENATMTEDEMSLRQAREFSENAPELMSEAYERVKAEAATEELRHTLDAQVREDIFTQLRDAGRSPEVAKTESEIWASFFRTMSERYGAGPDELSKLTNVRIIGPGMGAVERTGREMSQVNRGSIMFPKDGVTEGQTVIGLFEDANLSTIAHETGHFFLEAFQSLASNSDAPQDMRADMDAVRKFLKVSDGKEITTEQHEKWARALEAYLMEGKAPSLELADTFARFKAWLTRIYQTLRGLNVRLTDEVREVMDRMLATDGEIQAARDVAAMDPLFATGRPAGMSQSDFETYQRMARRSQEKAEQSLLEKTMAKVRREREAWFKTEKKAVREEVEAELNRRPEYRLIELFANQRWLGETEAEIPDLQLDRDSLVEMFGPEILDDLSRSKLGGKRAIYWTEGMDLAAAADFFGFTNSIEMVETLQTAGKRTDAIRIEVDRRMSERHGDPLNDGTIEIEALNAIHNEQQAKTSIAEARHLAGQLGVSSKHMLPKSYRHRARVILRSMRVAEAVRPRRFLQAERRAARRAQEAFARVARSGGPQALTEALQAKEQQILNGYLYDEASRLQKEVSRKREKMRDYNKKSVREKLAGGYIEQIDAILADYDFRVRPASMIQREESLKDFVQRMVEEGREAELSIDPKLLERTQAKHFSLLSVEDLQGLFDTVENLDHLGRFKQKLIEKNRRRELATSTARVADQVRSNLGAGKAKKQSGVIRNTFNLLATADTMLIAMDGGQEIGASYDEIKRGIDAGQAEEHRMSVELAERMDKLFAAYTSKEIAGMQSPKRISGANGRPWTKLEILSVALNTGNAENLSRLLDPTAHAENRLTQDQLDALLGQLDKRDWQFVQSMWDLIDSYWPQLAEVSERRTGVKPTKVEAVPFENAHGTWRGGYYPIKYDPELSAPAMRDEQSAWDKFVSAGRDAKAAVRNGMTIERKNSSDGRTLKFDMTVPFTHLRDTIRLVTLSEAVDNSHRILNHRDVRQAFIDAGRVDDLNTLNLWLKDVANGPIFNTDPINTFARTIKNNFTLSRLAFNFRTVALQVTGLGQSAATIGKRNLMRGMLDYRKRPHALTREVMEKSTFMAERQSTFQKDIYDFANDVKISTPIASRWAKARTVVGQWGFAPIIKAQFYAVDMPTWLGAYRAEFDRTQNEATAIAFADRMVARAQDSGLMADRSGFERGTLSANTRQSDFVRLFTTLGGYMIKKLNRGYVTTVQGRSAVAQAEGSAAKLLAASNAASDLALLYVFEAAFMALAYSMLFDDEDEDVQGFMVRETGMAVVAGIPLVRDAASAFNGYGGGGVYGSVLEIPANLYQQTVQGENDPALRRALADLVGTATGLPSTATMRILEGALTPEDTSAAEMLFGSNPLNR
ncbi:hypothetical protein ACSQ76_08380 [Roseovarius sp. B08]|uniref:hypothetical protein n=1 Tax=Roseovarius sp. B08 TaxID=3449223 RepID=UPI003EDB9D89